MECKDYLKRYVKYGVVKNEREYVELWSLTMDIVRTLYPYEFSEGGVVDSILGDKLMKFNIGFCEGCLFQNIYTIMRLIHGGYDDKEITQVLEVNEELVNEIRKEYVLRSGAN